jgi:hypothetical protein
MFSFPVGTLTAIAWEKGEENLKLQNQDTGTWNELLIDGKAPKEGQIFKVNKYVHVYIDINNNMYMYIYMNI